MKMGLEIGSLKTVKIPLVELQSQLADLKKQSYVVWPNFLVDADLVELKDDLDSRFDAGLLVGVMSAFALFFVSLYFSSVSGWSGWSYVGRAAISPWANQSIDPRLLLTPPRPPSSRITSLFHPSTLITHPPNYPPSLPRFFLLLSIPIPRPTPPSRALFGTFLTRPSRHAPSSPQSAKLPPCGSTTSNPRPPSRASC